MRVARGVAVWWVCVVLLVGLLAGGVLVGRGSVLAGRGSRVAAAGGLRVAGVPSGLAAVAQRVIGGSDRAFWVARRGRVLVASGGGVSSVFAASGVRVSASRGSVDLRLVAVGGRGLPALTAGVTPLASGDLVRYRRGGVLEWYRNGPLGLEQGFTVARGGAGARAGGMVVLRLRVGGSLNIRQAGSQVLFTSRAGDVVLRYGGLSAWDASGRRLGASIQTRDGSVLLRVDARAARYPVIIDPFIEQDKIVPRDLTDDADEGAVGTSVALSTDGNTALIGGIGSGSTGTGPGGGAGAAWVFTQSGTGWREQHKIVPTDEAGDGSEFGFSVALSADGDTALIGGDDDGSSNAGAAWVYTRSGVSWSEQQELVPNDETGDGSEFGSSVALSADGSTALIGGPYDGPCDGCGYGATVGTAWVYTRSGVSWSEQQKLVPSDETGDGSEFGSSVALSADGSTALIGGPGDGQIVDEDIGPAGAAWVYTRSGASWSEQQNLGPGDDSSQFGSSVALSADGSTALIGAPNDGICCYVGAAWVYTRSGAYWNEQQELAPNDETSDGSNFGSSVALSADGGTALISGPDDGISSTVGAAWVYTRSGASWDEHQKIVPNDEAGDGSAFGSSVALSADGSAALIGGPVDGKAGAAWVYGAIATGSPQWLAFRSQIVSRPGSVLWIPAQNSGKAPLRFTGAASITGTNPGDFAIPGGDNLCEGQTLARGQSCWIGVRFTPKAAGVRSATVNLAASQVSSLTSLAIALIGTGVAANAATANRTVPAASNGPVELMNCKTVSQTVVKNLHGKRTKVKVSSEVCTTKSVSAPVSFATSNAGRAQLSRSRVIYATGIEARSAKHPELAFSGTRTLPAGRYTLTVSWMTGHKSHTTREAIALQSS
ncbi:MAG: choice-of-anchor D domain-containing protein [Solirubrobacteraceae bacterium]